MAKREVKDEEGNPIDPAKNLGAWLETVGASPGEVVETQTPVPSWETAVYDGDDPELKGKTGKEVSVALAERKRLADEATSRAAQLQAQLEEQKRTQQIEATTRRVLAEQQAAAAKPLEPKEDPRVAQANELWLTDPVAAHQLINEINEEKQQKELKRVAEETERRVLGTVSQAEIRKQIVAATEQATKELLDAGVPQAELDARAHHVMQEVCLQVLPNGRPSKYFAQGGPTRAANIVAAYKELFGVPTPAAAAAAPSQAAPVPFQPPPAPPGSNKPAPAATTATRKEVHLSNDQKRDINQMANAFGLDPAKLEARRRKRLEGDAHA